MFLGWIRVRPTYHVAVGCFVGGGVDGDGGYPLFVVVGGGGGGRLHALPLNQLLLFTAPPADILKTRARRYRQTDAHQNIAQV